MTGRFVPHAPDTLPTVVTTAVNVRLKHVVHGKREGDGGSKRECLSSYPAAVDEFRRALDNPAMKWNPCSEKEPADIAILTVIPEEFHAVRARLNDPTFFRCDGVANVYSWHTSEVVPTHGNPPYRVVLAMSGRGSQAPALSCAHATISRFRPRYVLLVGIAGGFARDGLMKGDVALSQNIYAYQYGALASGMFKPRHDFGYRPDIGLWTAATTLSSAWGSGLVPPSGPRVLRAVPGNIASGDLLVDDRSPEFWKQVEASWERLLAVEMEGAAAAHAVEAANAQNLQVGFMMVRGISDMPPDGAATTASAPESDISAEQAERAAWKVFASDSAAAFAVHWIRTQWPQAPRQDHNEGVAPRLATSSVVNHGDVGTQVITHGPTTIHLRDPKARK